MSDVLLRIKNGRKSFQNEPILDKINLEIKSGEFVALLGASGSGKTTLLRLLAGIETWTQGEMEKPLNIESGFVFQEPNLLGWRTVQENLRLPLELRNKKTDLASELKTLQSVRLENAANLYPHELSGGMKMRASIARALITEPNLLFMDEPFSALDEPTREELQVQLRRIWESSATTILFVTHSLSEAVFLANRIIILGDTPATIKSDHASLLPQERRSELRSSTPFFEELKMIRTLFYQNQTRGT